MDTVSDLLSSLDSNTLNTIVNLGNQKLSSSVPLDPIKNLFTPSVPVSQLQAVGAPITGVAAEFKNDIDTLRNIGLALTSMLILWTIFLVTTEYLFKDTKFKDDIKYMNDILFGNSGFLNNLFMVWVIVLSAIYVIYGLQFLSTEILSINKTMATTVSSSIPIIGKILKFFK